MEFCFVEEYDPETRSRAFHRWLAAHDAEVRTSTQRGGRRARPCGSTATGYYASEQDSGYRDAERDAKQWLRARAEQTKEDS